jgi:hypothetical protein
MALWSAIAGAAALRVRTARSRSARARQQPAAH